MKSKQGKLKSMLQINNALWTRAYYELDLCSIEVCVPSNVNISPHIFDSLKLSMLTKQIM